MDRMMLKKNYKVEEILRPAPLFRKTESLYKYEEFDLTDIDRIVRFYIQKQRNKNIALCNVAAIMNNIIDSPE